MDMTTATVSTELPEKTCKTAETFNVSNEEFLGAIFRDVPDGVRPIVVNFAGNPGTAPKSCWAGRSWTEASAGMLSSDNNYFSLSAFNPDKEGSYRRRKAQFYACFSIMLDDVGTKVDSEGLKLEPSWLLETSEGNYQAGYILKEPITEEAQATQLAKAVIAAGLCDPGAGGPSARLARLPIAINGKYDPIFSCRLESWRPDLTYTPDELVVGLGLSMGPAQNKQANTVAPVNAAATAVWQPRPQTNPVIASLMQRGLYKSALDEGKHDVSCPWVSEHTGQVDGGSAYFEPDDDYPSGGFKCFHGHCDHRSIHDLLEVLQVEPEAARMLPVIRVVDGDLHRVVDAAEKSLAERGQYFQRGGAIVTVRTDPSTQVTQIANVGVDELTLGLGRVADWRRFDGRSKGWVRKDPSCRHVNILLRKGAYRYLSPLAGIARQPYLRADGSLVTAPEYDLASAMYGAFDASHYRLPQSPSVEQAKESLDLLRSLLEDFEFASSTDEAVALSAMLTAAIRISLPAAPMFHVSAHVPGSGKSYLCSLIAALASPNRGEPTAFPSDDVECGKVLLATLMTAPAVIEFDNLTSDLLAHKSLCTALTSEDMSGRVLGQSKTVSVSTRALFLSSGNNVGPVNDMTRRCLTVGLSCKSEHPAQRTFQRPDLLEAVRERRGECVSAALTIICAWIEAGGPGHAGKNLASYGLWSDYCRAPLIWLGCHDPVDNLFRRMTEDPERELLGRLLQAWSAMFGKKALRVRDVLSRVQESTQAQAMDLSELLDDIAGDRSGVNARRLGWWLKRNAGRVVDGRQLSRLKGGSSGGLWTVQ
jgi:hypothetical protein